MTLVNIELRNPDDTPAEGTVQFVPTKRLGVDDHIVLPLPFGVALVDGLASVELLPNGVDWLWHIIEHTRARHQRYVAVQDSASPVLYKDLIDVDPTTLAPAAEPEAAWWALADTLPAEAAVVGDDLVITRVDNSTYVAGNVRGPQGSQGIQGIQGNVGDLFPASSATLSSPNTDLIATATPQTRRITLGGNLTFNNLPAGTSTESFSVTIVLVQDATGGRVVTWPTNLSWSEAVKPIVPTAPNSRHVYNLLWDGANWTGAVAGTNFA